jgi:ElaB/YqjD/DUF883 family membrane-anchored ribosome-binding protein
VNNGNGAENSEIVNNGMEKLAAAEKIVKAKAAKAERKLSSVAESASDTIDDGAEEIRTRFEAFEEKLHNSTDRLLESARTLGGATSKQLSAHPLVAIGIAFAVGVGVARLLRR